MTNQATLNRAGMFLLIASWMLVFPAPGSARQVAEPAGQTLEEFKEYVGGKLSGISGEQLDAIAKRVDANGDEFISESEFEARMEAVQAVMSAAEGVTPADVTKKEEGDSKMANGKPEIAAGVKGSLDISKRADVLIVTSPELEEAWQAFADWKTKTGRPAKIVTTKMIEEKFEGDDIQQKIRACCLKHISDQQTRWVVLGGDSTKDAGLVPDRDTDHSECEMLPYDDIPTDLYYISEKDWDANDDGRYGVFADDMDEVAYFNPNASIGRIPVRTPEDVMAYTDKVIAYESRYPVGDFAMQMIYTCPEEHAYPKLKTSIDQVKEAWSGGGVRRFFGNQTPWDDEKRGDHALSAANWVEMLNQRNASKIHMHGHGLLPLWVLENDSKVTSSSVAELNNENAYPIITTVSCLTGQYDNRKDPSIVESMLRRPKAGAIAILAPSREGVPFMKNRRDFQLMMTEGKMDGTTTAYTKFWQAALQDKLTLGEAFRQVKMEMESDARENIGFHMVQCELNLLGDPTLAPHAQPPQRFNARARGSNGKISVRGVPGATICVWDGADRYLMVQANERGRAVIELENASGKFHVSAMAPGFNTWSKMIEVAAAEPKESE